VYHRQSFYTIKEVRDLVAEYIDKNELNQKGGQIRLDPLVVHLLAQKPPLG